MDLKYILLIMGLVLLVGTASAEGEPTNVNMDTPYNKTLLDIPMWFNATADSATSYVWDFGDGQTSTAQHVQHVFTTEGDYFVTLTAENEFGNATIGREIVAQRNVFASDGADWTQVREMSRWDDDAWWWWRGTHTSVVYDGKMWLMGGYDDDGGTKNDVWWSTDGNDWTRATANAGWGYREKHASVVYDGKMWVIGGYSSSTDKNDVWWSTDGTTWTQATAAAAWSARHDHTAVVSDGKMWVIGGTVGYTTAGNKNDVWWSTDGVEWTQATAAAAWSGRYDHTSVVHDGKLWVMGGISGTTEKNDVWWSTNGTTWTQATAAAAWGKRTSHTSVVYDGKMWVIGGSGGNDVWWSTNGIAWTRATAAAAWSGRYDHTSVVYNERMWVIGGHANYYYLNDVYSTTIGTSPITAPSPAVVGTPASFETLLAYYATSSYIWNFGDGQTSTDVNATHTYTAGGDYTVTLTIADEVNGLATVYTTTVSVESPPTANFTADVTMGAAPLTVAFTDLSTESPTAWAWDVDNDGTVDYTTRNCTHTYAANGMYTVSLNASNAVGYNVATVADYINVGDAPTNVGMTIPYNKTLLDAPMWFNATADGATAWFWDFGDGTNATSQNVKKSFTTEGDYFVTLKAENEFGNTTIGQEVLARRNVFASDGVGWTQATASAGWSARSDYTSVVYDGKMWVMGGYGGSRDVWWSTDGITWTQATASAGWSARYHHTSVVYDGKMWVMGGYGGSNKRDVWWSTDGITWTQATASAGWSGRYGHTSVVYDGKMWVIGGYDGSLKNDVWWSTDGITWTRATASAGWSGRYFHTSVVYDGKMWVMGGDDGSRKNDVWWSTDGITWTRATASAGWSARNSHTSVVYDGKMWVIGGGGVSPAYKNDVWRSTDGITWTQATASAGWSARMSHTSVVYDGKMWVMGGYGGSNKRDVWRSTVGQPIVQPSPPLMTGTAIPFSTPLDYYNHTSYLWDFGDGHTATGAAPSHTYAEAGTYTVTLTMPDEVNGIQTVYTEEITIGESPTAAFTANTTAGLTPLTVQFTDESTGSPTSWSWTFGDGGTATTKNPSRTYTSPGTYTVNLTVSNAYGSNTITKINYITVQSLATVAFAANKTTVYAYDPVQFTDQSTGADLSAWAWSFGDGETSTDQNPVHSYTTEGTYTVTLNVTNPAGTATLTKSNYVAVNPVPPPTVVFTANRTTVYPDEPVLFTDQSTNDRFPIHSWNWSFGDGAWINQSVNDSVTYAYDEPGTYTVELFVTGYGGTASKTKTVTVDPIPVPTVAFTANKTTVYPNETILFTDKTTTTDNFPMYTWNWSFGDGQWTNQSVNDSVEHAYVAPGSYDVTLYVTGEGGTGSKTLPVTVEPFPVPVVDFTANVTAEIRPVVVQFTDRSTYEPVQWHWDFGDGYDSTDQNPVHTYKYEGTYAVKLTAWNVNGQNSTTKTNYITVNLPPLPTLRDLHIQNNGVTVTDYQIPYEVTNDDEFFGLLQSNPAHLEVYNGAGSASYYFWIESFNTMTNSSKIWIKIPTLTGGGATTQVRLKYNDDRDEPISDGDKTFLLFDAFDTVQINDEEWQVGGSPTLSIGSLHLDAGDSLVSTPSYPYHGVAIDVRAKTGNNDLDVAMSTAGTNWKTTGDGFGMTVNNDLTARAINNNQITMETAPGISDANYHVYTVYEIDSSLVYQRDGITQKIITSNQPDVNLNAVLQGEGEVDWIFVRKFSTQDYVYLIPPKTNFTANPAFGVAPLTVQFTDTSLNSPTSWAWEFGDGATSTEQHPVHTFEEIGNHTVTLTSSNFLGSDTNTLVVAATLPLPVANFTQNVTTGDEPLTVQFTDTSLYEPDRWFWKFGDGATSTVQNPVHTYMNGGTYPVNLTVTSFAGNDTLYVPAAVIVGHVYVEPIAAFSAPTTVNKDTIITFTDTSANEPFTWYWEFGDGETATTQSPTHHYTTPGTYPVSLTVTNPAGSNTTTRIMTVLERMPVAAFTGTPTVGDHPLTVTFIDKTNNNPTSWTWAFGDGVTSTERNPTHTYANPGAYTVTLTATNERGVDDEVKTEYIRVGVPDVAFTANVTDGNKPLTVQFTDESTKQPTSWFWKFGDGMNSTEQNPVHTYTTAGRKTVTLTATNSNGPASVTRPRYITVVELPPVAAFSAPTTINRYRYAQFIDQSDNNPTRWEWAFGDGETYTTSDYRYRNTTYRYTTPGTYTVTLKVTNAIGSDTTTRTVVVNQVVPNAAFTATNTFGNAPVTVQFTDQSTNEPTAWVWEFGDGTNSTSRNPSHTYTEPGTYSVTLTTANSAGTASITKPDLVAVNTPMIAMTCNPTMGEKPLTVQFTDQSTNEPTTWFWKFGDGTTSTEQHPTHVYDEGVYSVTLTATNTYGTTTKTFWGAVRVYEWVPTAAFTSNATSGDKPLTVQFTDLSVNTPTSWSWSFGDGTTSTSRNPVHTYKNAGVYTVELIATNPKGSNNMTKTNYVTVEELPPVTAFTVDHTYTIVGQDVQFTDQSQNNPTQWVWTFGDGTTSSLKNPRHTYTDPGTYTVTLRVTNEKGQSDLIKINYVTADIHVPIADFECNPVLGPSPLTVQFTDESEFLPYLWFWDFGDGTTSTVQHPTHTYTVPGTYTVVLRSSNAVGSDTITRPEIITVQLPDVNFTASPTLGGSPMTVKFTTDGSPDWSYHWSFGDGTTSNEQNPVHVYKTTRDQQFFTVSLTVAYGGEEQDIVKPNYIDVRTKSIETFMAEQQENIGGVVAIGAVMATIAGIIVIYLGL